jgi:nitrogen-specific signal transduction histidine kinase
MVTRSIDDLISNYIFDEPVQILVNEITNHIKFYNDYDSAIKLILANNLNIENIVRNTARLKTNQMDSIIYELRANDIKEDDIQFIMEKVKNRISEQNIDIELEKLGYPKVFTVDYDDYSYEYDMDEDDEF